ncbi:hypothetical protein ABID22_003132 [Pontibacter aydingkolensis]|uniref:DUF4468 domain-containing protein n=1 Tax=Pontibacter aydingkolensis TaxID=1911536 RepID=A0ABS7CXZ9_9BACT|nr:hypothetical protein [Pontibacter aydingkolensis]MBW7468713.1 hypothetical protein [Pontibacter aydingkolensis]
MILKKPLLLCLIVFILSVPALAQNLSLRHLLKYREMEVAELNQKLTNKGWQFVSDNKPTGELMGQAVWAYNLTTAGEGATAWCVLYYNDTSPSRILYNVYVGNAIPKIQKNFRRRKMSPVSEGSTLNGVEHLEHYTDLPDPKYVFRLMKYKQPGYNGIKIFEKSDYEKASENGRL